MWERLDSYVKAIWTRYGIWPFAALLLLVLGAAYLFGVDLGGWLNNLLGVR